MLGSRDPYFARRGSLLWDWMKELLYRSEGLKHLSYEAESIVAAMCL